MADVRALQSDELTDFNEALDYFKMLVTKHGKAA